MIYKYWYAIALYINNLAMVLNSIILESVDSMKTKILYYNFKDYNLKYTYPTISWKYFL